MNTADPQFAKLRHQMVERQLRARGISDERVLRAMEEAPRHQFVSASQRPHAYEDRPLSIGHGQTISQPYIVALMTELARPTPDSRALDVGTGSGYQAAVLAQLCKEVYSMDIVEPLVAAAKQQLSELSYDNVIVRQGDGYRGWPEHAPYDVILAAAAPESVPHPLIEQLAPGGRMVLPVGQGSQELIVIEKAENGEVNQRKVAAVAFVPMTGEAQQRRA